MGYFIKGKDKIATVTDPEKFTLANNPNFVKFEAVSNSGNSQPLTVTITLKNCGYVYVRPEPHGYDIYKDVSNFAIVEKVSGAKHNFRGTSSLNEAGQGVFYTGYFKQGYEPNWTYYRERTVDTLIECLRQNDFIRRNFIVIPGIINSDITSDKHWSFTLKAKGVGEGYAFSFEGGEEFFTYDNDPSGGSVTDSISEGKSPVELHLELYKDTTVFPGITEALNTKNIGQYVTTLTKAYTGDPLWLNLNILKNDEYSTDFLKPESTWFDPKTMTDYRFIAKRFISATDFIENSMFYVSDVFYTLNGYRRSLEKNDLSTYVYDVQKREQEDAAELKDPLKPKSKKPLPLTTQPQLFHIAGQTQFFNFVLSDALHNDASGGNLGINYKFYSQSGLTLGEKTLHTRPKKDFAAINTIRLDIDGAMTDYPQAGRVEVFLVRQTKPEEKYLPVSQPLKFTILPSCLYKVNDFAFLNSLGGWSSFNFGGTDQSEFKAKANTYFQTHTPDKVLSSKLESVYSSEVEEQFTVQTMPVTRAVADWLRELSASTAVYELSSGRYIIVDDLTIKPNSKDELFRLDMKFHYSDSYNGL